MWLFLSYKDAVKGGDRMRVLECWRYFISVFHNADQINEAFIFLTQHFHDLLPQKSQQLLYNRFVNTIGIRGLNIPQNLHLEHLN